MAPQSLHATRSWVHSTFTGAYRRMPSAGEISRCASPHSTRAFSSLQTVLWEVRGSTFFARSHRSVMVTGSVPARKTSRTVRRLLVNLRPAPEFWRWHP
jgi:hypothetical protein